MTKLPEIIGVAGTNGAGKDVLADERRTRQHARKVGLSDILRVEATKRGLNHERSTLGAISNEMTAALGAGALSLMTIREYYERKGETETGLSTVSIRRPAEAAAIQAEGGMVLWIDADRAIRYERIRSANRGRVDDLVSYEEFCRQEDAEMHPADDTPGAMNMAGVREIADIHVINEFENEAQYADYLLKEFELTS